MYDVYDVEIKKEGFNFTMGAKVFDNKEKVVKCNVDWL